MPSTGEFFDELGRRGHEPLLRRVSATIRFDIEDGAATEHRTVRIERGDLRVSDEAASAGCSFTCSRAEFDDLVAGRTSVMASLLRGALMVDGDPELLVLAQRLLAGAPHPAPARDASRADGTSGGGAAR